MAFIETAGPGVFEELMDFLEDAYKTDTSSRRFEELAPDLYRKDSEYLANYHFVREGGEIAAGLGLFPVNLAYGGSRLRIPCVGGVATGRKFRGKSYMSTLLDFAAEKIRAEDPPFTWLAGLRQRYGRWGWERAGSTISLTLSPKNISSTFKNAGFATRELQWGELPWDFMLGGARRPKFRGDSPAGTAKHKLKRPGLRFFVAEKDGVAEAYLVMLNGDKAANTPMTVAEFGGSTEGLAAALLEITAADPRLVAVGMPSCHDEFFRMFLSAAENWHVMQHGNFGVVNLEKCLGLAGEKPSLSTEFMRDCGANIVIEAGKYPERRAFIGVVDGKLEVSGGRGKFPELRLGAEAAAALIFGPARPSVLLGDKKYHWLDALLPVVSIMPPLQSV